MESNREGRDQAKEHIDQSSKQMKHLNEMKIGAFVISGLCLLVFGWAYLREFAIHKQLVFNVVFDDVAGLTKGSFVRINGLRVGRVDKLTLDTKENKVIVQPRIQIPGVTIPNDSMIFIRTSGYVGDKYLDITLGSSSRLIMDGELVIGEPTIDPFRSLEVISQIVDKLNPNEISKSITDVTVGTANLVKNFPQGHELRNLIERSHDTVEKLNVAIQNAKGFASDQDAQSNLNKLLSQASVITNDLNQSIKNANDLANNKAAFENVNALLIRASRIIEQLDEIRADPLIQNELRETLTNTNIAAKKIAFTSDEVSMVLNQRFILPRLLFWKLMPSKTKKDKKN